MLQGRVVLVTGGSRGIGRATAIAVARAGADVAIGYRRDARAAESVQREIESIGRRCIAVRFDVTRADEAESFVRSAQDRFGPIDGLVANAGVLHVGPFLETTDEAWSELLQTDVLGPVNCIRAALPGMLSQGAGSIVIVSSRLAQIGWPGHVAYSTAKAALLGLTKSLAREVAPHGVRVNAVAPGVIATDMTQGTNQGDDLARRASDIPIRRFGRPEEVAEAIVFLLADASSLFVGQTLNPNGGGYMP